MTDIATITEALDAGLAFPVTIANTDGSADSFSAFCRSLTNAGFAIDVDRAAQTVTLTGRFPLNLTGAPFRPIVAGPREGESVFSLAVDCDDVERELIWKWGILHARIAATTANGDRVIIEQKCNNLERWSHLSLDTHIEVEGRVLLVSAKRGERIGRLNTLTLTVDPGCWWSAPAARAA